MPLRLFHRETLVPFILYKASDPGHFRLTLTYLGVLILYFVE